MMKSDNGSDNGGNFVSGGREPNRSMKEWNQEKFADFLLQRNVQWAFNPLSVQPIVSCWNLCQGGHILQVQVEASPVLIECILAQMGKGISHNFAREAKMVQAAPKCSNPRYRTAHR